MIINIFSNGEVNADIDGINYIGFMEGVTGLNELISDVKSRKPVDVMIADYDSIVINDKSVGYLAKGDKVNHESRGSFSFMTSELNKVKFYKFLDCVKALRNKEKSKKSAVPEIENKKKGKNK